MDVTIHQEFILFTLTVPLIIRKNQTATKTLTVWRYPDFLIIILKRFVYLEKGPGGMAGSVKLDNRVEFPIKDLDLNPFLSG